MTSAFIAVRLIIQNALCSNVERIQKNCPDEYKHNFDIEHYDTIDDGKSVQMRNCSSID